MPSAPRATGRTRAAVVQQNQCALGTQAAKRERVYARTTLDHKAGELVVELGRTRSDAGALEEFSGVHLSELDLSVCCDDLDRRR